MMDVKPLKGTRCRAGRAIIGHQGIVKANTEGTIQHVIDNLDRHLINVEWDNGVTMNAFPDELVIQQKEGALVPVCWEDDRSIPMTDLHGVKIAISPTLGAYTRKGCKRQFVRWSTLLLLL